MATAGHPAPQPLMVPVKAPRFTAGLFHVERDPRGEGADLEEILDRQDNLTIARAIYRGRVSQYPGLLIMLCDRARVLARSDRPETMP
jgi:hypothetical protein